MEVTPPVDLYNLNSLPLDLQKQTALKLPFTDIISLCKSSKGLNKLCNDLYFWKDYFNYNIKEKIDIPEDANVKWYQNKIKYYFEIKDLIDKIREEEFIVICKDRFNKNWNNFEMADNIIQINCGYKGITSLPSLPNLEILNCNDNQLTTLPSYPKLQIFHCNNNKITYLPSYPNLTKLYCRNNSLITLPEYHKLEKLDCRNNKITYLPEYPELEKLNCDNNQLITLSKYPKLIDLSCHGNPLPFYTLEEWQEEWSK